MLRSYSHVRYADILTRHPRHSLHLTSSIILIEFPAIRVQQAVTRRIRTTWVLMLLKASYACYNRHYDTNAQHSNIVCFPTSIK